MGMYNETEMRQDFQKIGWALVLSQLTMFFLSMLLSLGASALLYLFSPLRATWAQMEGWVVMLSALGGAAPMLLFGRDRQPLGCLFDQRERVWPVQVAFYFLMVLGLQMLTSMLSVPIVNILESAGASFDAASQAATSYSRAGSMLFYSVLAAPVCEELVYRGVLLRALEPYGRWFAISLSALVFALMHGNAVQLPAAFVIGLVFGYLSLKYSLRLTILLHVLNNLFVEFTGRLTAFSEGLGSMVDSSLMLAGLLTLILMALSGGKPVWRDLRAEKTPRAVYREFLTSGPVAATFLYMIALTVSSVVR